MNRYLLTAGLLATLLGAGCQGRQDNADRESGPGTAGVKARSAKAAQLVKPMFDNYRPGFAYRVRSDKTSTNQNGVSVRRVTIEYTGKASGEISDLVARDLAGHGYKKRASQVRGGVPSARFVKKGSESVSVLFPPSDADQDMSDSRDLARYVWKPKK